MLLTGRILGWLMVLAGIALLASYFGQWIAAGRMIPMTMSDIWEGGDAVTRSFMERSALSQFSAAMLSGWGSSLLIIFGALLIWGCRRGPKRR